MGDWVDVCATDDIDEEDVMRFDRDGRSFATHENVHLSQGLVMGNIIECPKHNGRFDYRTGEAKGAPVCVNLKTYPVRIVGGRVQIEVG